MSADRFQGFFPVAEIHAATCRLLASSRHCGKFRQDATLIQGSKANAWDSRSACTQEATFGACCKDSPSHLQRSCSFACGTGGAAPRSPDFARALGRSGIWGPDPCGRRRAWRVAGRVMGRVAAGMPLKSGLPRAVLGRNLRAEYGTRLPIILHNQHSRIAQGSPCDRPFGGPFGGQMARSPHPAPIPPPALRSPAKPNQR